MSAEPPRRSNGLFSFPRASPLPLVPRILIAGPAAGELHREADFWSRFTENCLVRGIGGGIAGGALGFVFGAVFSTGMGSLSAHDPALRDWQASVAARGAAGGAALPGSLPFPAEPPKQPLLRVMKEGLLEVRVGGRRGTRSRAAARSPRPPRLRGRARAAACRRAARLR
jgi:hypothetical protein